MRLPFFTDNRSTLITINCFLWNTDPTSLALNDGLQLSPTITTIIGMNPILISTPVTVQSNPFHFIFKGMRMSQASGTGTRLSANGRYPQKKESIQPPCSNTVIYGDSKFPSIPKCHFPRGDGGGGAIRMFQHQVTLVIYCHGSPFKNLFLPSNPHITTHGF